MRWFQAVFLAAKTCRFSCSANTGSWRISKSVDVDFGGVGFCFIDLSMLVTQ
jgi:hypothetical protein